jgi:hypothetical protein
MHTYLTKQGLQNKSKNLIHTYLKVYRDCKTAHPYLLQRTLSITENMHILSNQEQLPPSPSTPLLELSKATFFFAICSPIAITYALWLTSIVETSQNMIFCSCSQSSLSSSFQLALLKLIAFIPSCFIFLLFLCLHLYEGAPYHFRPGGRSRLAGGTKELGVGSSSPSSPSNGVEDLLGLFACFIASCNDKNFSQCLILSQQ